MRVVAPLLVLLVLGCSPQPSDTGARPAGVTYADLAPIVERSCASCHRPEGPAPFALGTYRELRESARESAQVTTSGGMPPWLPDGEATFEGDRRLTPREIASFEAWVMLDRPHGEGEVTLAAVDPVDGVATEAVAVAADAAAFVHEFTLDATRFVDSATSIGAFRLDAEPARLVRHVRLHVERDGERTDPGQLIGWLPGIPERPLDAEWSLAPGDRIVLSTWIDPDHLGGSLRLTLDLQARTSPAGAARETRTVEGGWTLPTEITLTAVAPLAPAKVRVVELTADERTLFRSARWDPAWREVYRFVEPVTLPAGTNVRVVTEEDSRPRHDRADAPFAGRAEFDVEFDR